MSEIIRISNLSKSFKLDSKKKSALEAALGIFKKDQKKMITVLDNISFDVQKGENFGIIGRNGSGKSTVLRIIAGIYYPDSGSIRSDGSITFLSTLNNGLQPKLTMRENIYLGGIMLGLSKKDIDKKLDAIVKFSGLKKFLDTNVSHFSSGMIARLNFSITIFCIEHNNSDILLLDEIFAGGGDKEFQEKAMKKMEEFMKSGMTIIMTSHQMNLIEKYCKRVIWLEKGKIASRGNSKSVCEAYMRSK